MKYNGGDPAVGEVRGRDDRPDVPYQHGDSIRTFLKLSCREGDVSQYEELRAPVEIPWSLPKNLLPIAEDAGGNCFILELGQKGGCVRFLDHEAIDEEITHHRVVADSFLDLLLRIVPVEEYEAKEQARSQRERRALQSGKFPALLAAQCRAVAKDHPEICEWCRSVCLKLFDQKGYFAVHDDKLSRLLLDLMFWLNQSARRKDAATKHSELATIMQVWWRTSDDGFGLSGYAPGFVEDWWKDRLATGALKGNETTARFSAMASAQLLQRVKTIHRRS